MVSNSIRVKSGPKSSTGTTEDTSSLGQPRRTGKDTRKPENSRESEEQAQRVLAGAAPAGVGQTPTAQSQEEAPLLLDQHRDAGCCSWSGPEPDLEPGSL